MGNEALIGGLLGGGGGAILGGLFGKKKKKKPKPNVMANIMQKLNTGYQQNYGLAEVANKKAIKSLEEGYGKALANAGLGASAAKQAVLGNQAQGLGALQQSLASSGLSNTTTNQNLQAGVYGQGSQALGQIDQNLGAMMAQLQQQKGQALAGAQGNMANFYQQKFNPLMQMGQMQQDNFWKHKAGKAAKGGSGLGGMLGGIAGSFFGPLGGMAGSAIGNSLFGGGGGGGGGLGGYGGGQFNPYDYMQYPQS